MPYRFCTRIIFILILALTLIQSCFSKNYTVKLGDSRVIVKLYPGRGKTYIHLHRNETTALEAAKALIKQKGGSLITIEHPGGRNLGFWLHKKHYCFDPNRIFTEKGIRKTLTLNSHYTPEAARQVKKLARVIKILLPAGKVIAVHNNKSYSLKNYFKGKSLASDVRALYYNPQKSYRNFVLVTRKSSFLRFKRAGWSTVLQKSHVRDDGSLSVYLAKRDYINIEAGYDQLTAQKRMLRLA